MFSSKFPRCSPRAFSLGSCLVLATVSISAMAVAQTTPAPAGLDRSQIDEVLRGLNRGPSVEQVAVSPDGKRIAWTRAMRDGSEILVASINDLAKIERISAGVQPDQHCHESEIAWEPDAKGLAFFSDCAEPGGQADLYIAKVDPNPGPEGNPARRITELRGYPKEPAFSPDGTRVAFLYVEGATRPAGALAAMKPPSGVIGEDGVEIQRVVVAALNVASPEAPEQVSPD